MMALPDEGAFEADELQALSDRVRQCDDRDRVGGELFVLARRFYGGNFVEAAQALMLLSTVALEARS